MKILVTGGTGFLGRAVIARLIGQGHAVSVLTRGIRGRKSLPDAVEILAWDPSNGKAPPLPEALSAVIHLAGEGIANRPWTKRQKEKLWKSRVEATRYLIRALNLLKKKPSSFIAASGMGYYGDAKDRLVSVSDPPGTDFLGRLAQAWESEAHAARAFGMRVATIRLGMILGRDGGALPRMALPFRFGLGATLGSGKQFFPWIHLDDAADLFCRAAVEVDFSGPYHAVAGEPITQTVFARALAASLRRPLLFRVPERALRLLLGDMADLILHGQRAEANAPGFSPRHGSLTETLHALI